MAEAPDLSMKEFAELTGRNVNTVRKLAREGKLPGAYRLGGSWKITRLAADRLRGLAPLEGQATDQHEN